MNSMVSFFRRTRTRSRRVCCCTVGFRACHNSVNPYPVNAHRRYRARSGAAFLSPGKGDVQRSAAQGSRKKNKGVMKVT